MHDAHPEPSPTETLRRVATSIREGFTDFAPGYADGYDLAVADLLDAQADLYEDWADPDSLHPADLHAPSHDAALRVARAYLQGA